MIVDTLDNLEKYVSLNPLFGEVVKFLKENDLNKLEDGKHFIGGDDLFVNITTAHGRPWRRLRLRHIRRCSIFRFLWTMRKPMVGFLW